MRYSKLNNENRSSRRNIPQQTPSNLYPVPAGLFTPQRCQIIACAFFALMLILGAIPGEANALSDAVGDKLLHLCAYSFLTCVLFGALRGTTAGRAWRTVVMIGVLGALDETIQSFMPYRNANLTDWTVDMLAAVLTVTILIIFSSSAARRWHGHPPSGRNTARAVERPN